MHWKDLISPESLKQLLANHREQLPLKGTSQERDFRPVTKLHIPGTYCLWLLTEVDTEGMAFGFCQISYGECGSVYLPEVAEMDIEGLEVVEDTSFVATITLSQYSNKARHNGGLLLP